MPPSWPPAPGGLKTEPADARFNYRHVVSEGLAFIRGIDAPAWEPVIAEVELLPHGQVMRWGPGIQIAFPLDQAARLMAVL